MVGSKFNEFSVDRKCPKIVVSSNGGGDYNAIYLSMELFSRLGELHDLSVQFLVSIQFGRSAWVTAIWSTESLLKMDPSDLPTYLPTHHRAN